MKKPNFFIVGAPKCGTTSMYYYLKQHPSIFFPNYVKEPHFFISDYPEINFKGSLSEYLDLFSDADNEGIIGEATTWYLYSKTSAKEIKDFCPGAKILIMLRNPVEAMFSLHGQWLFSLNENIKEFSKAIATEKDRQEGYSFPPNMYFREGLYYTKVYDYQEQIERYFTTFGRSNVKVVILEKFIQDKKKIYSDVLNFLQVDPNFVPNFEIKNKSKKPRSASVIKLLRSNNKFKKFLSIFFSKKFRNKIGRIIKEVNTKEITQKRELSEKVRNELQQKFKEKIFSLEKLLDTDLEVWR